MKRNGLNALVLIMLFALIVLPNFGCAIAGDKSVSDAKKTNARESCPPCEKPTPETNAEIRLWYNHQVVIIPALDKRWVEDGVDAAERAKRAYEIRHNARINARALMKNRLEVEMLRARDMEKYGHPDGPTFLQLVEKNCAKGLRGDEIYEAIVQSSSRTSAEFNKRFGIESGDP